MHTRIIPATGETIPVIGCGTWKAFDVGSDKSARAPLAEVLRRLFKSGGTVIDGSPMYGAAEQVVGEILNSDLSPGDRAPAENLPQQPFIATKVWTRGREAGIEQMRRSMKLFQCKQIDLMQVHNLLDWRTHLPTLRDWKAQGLIRYLGVTHYTSSAYADLESVLRAEQLDFVQLNYSLDDRAAEQRLLPLAHDRRIAVLVNRPLGEGQLVRKLNRKPLTPWAVEYGCTTWAQLALKFVLAHPAVTCVIPGTGNSKHMLENCQAGAGKSLDARLCEELVQRESATA